MPGRIDAFWSEGRSGEVGHLAVRGQVVKASVVLRDGHAASDATAKALQDFVKGEIAPYKYPHLVEFVDALPRTQTGELQRFRLREMEA